jgi:hypothetical protein
MRLIAVGILVAGLAATASSTHIQARAMSGAASATAETWREITIPAGTALPLVLDTSVGSDISRIEQPIHAHLGRAILVNGVTAIPSGSAVSGVVTDARRSGKVKGRAHVSFRFQTLTPQGDSERYRMQTRLIGRTAPATKKADALKIGVPAAGGAALGGLVGGKKGAAIGAAAGGGGGTAVVLATRGKEVRIGRGATVLARLAQPLTVRVRS